MTPATIGPNAYLLDSVKNSFEIRNGEKSVDELGISAPNDKEFIVELKQPTFLLSSRFDCLVSATKSKICRSARQRLRLG